MKQGLIILLSAFVSFSGVHASPIDSVSVLDSTITFQKKPVGDHPRLVLNLDMIDLPYQVDAMKTVDQGNASLGGFFKGYANPSMHQSLQLTTSLYSGVHYGIGKLFGKDSYTSWSKNKRFAYSLALIAGDYFLTTAPGFDGWVHEEYHRSVLTRFGVNSFNDMNKFPIGSESVSVSHVTDEDLIRFKQQSPTDFIRSHVAGIEGEYLLAEKLQRNKFFYNQNMSHEFLYILTILNAVAYVNISASPMFADAMTIKMNEKEGTVSVRDYTGIDFAGWTYDLFRPDEPYANRGIHPSGLGIDRYIKTTDLTTAELSYLKTQGKLQLLNLLSPMIYGFRDIKLNNSGLYCNFAVRNYLTSFGNDISANVFLKNNRHNYVFTAHNYNNYKHYFPSLEMELVDDVQSIGSQVFYISPRVLIGLQPANQSFTTDKASFVGLLEYKMEYKTKVKINPYIELSAKTKGWVAGNEFLNSNFSIRMGVSMRIYK